MGAAPFLARTCALSRSHTSMGFRFLNAELFGTILAVQPFNRFPFGRTKFSLGVIARRSIASGIVSIAETLNRRRI